MATRTCLHITKYLIASIYITAMAFTLKAITTTHWIHYWNGTDVIQYGLWSSCRLLNNGNQTNYTWTVSISDDITDLSVPVALIINVVFTLILFPYLLQIPYISHKTTKDGVSFMMILCSFSSAVFGLVGVGRFTMKVMDSKRKDLMTFEMSYYIASICVSVETLLLPFTYWYARNTNEYSEEDDDGE